MKARELREMGKPELEKKMQELRKELMQDYTQISAGTPPKSPGLLRQRKKTIARIFTILNSKENKKTEIKQETGKKTKNKEKQKQNKKEEKARI